MDSLGTFGALYQCQEPAGVVLTRVIYRDVPESLRCALDLSPDDVSSGILSRSVFLGAEVRGWQDNPCVQTGALRRHGAEPTPPCGGFVGGLRGGDLTPRRHPRFAASTQEPHLMDS
jgi:hypothetical protein